MPCFLYRLHNYSVSDSASHCSISSSSLFPLASCSLESSCNNCIFVPLAGSCSCESISALRVSSCSISASVFFSSFSIFLSLACSSFCCCQFSLLPGASLAVFLLLSCKAVPSCALSASSFFSR